MKKIYTTTLLVISLMVGSLVLAAAVPRDVFANQSCGNADTSIISCDDGVDGVWALLMIAINILTAGVFIAAIGGVVYGSILYTSAGGNQEQVKKARTILTNVVIGMVAFAMMFALLQWLIPGGLFNSSGDIEGITLLFNQREVA